MESIAIIIPVYERPKRVAGILSRLLADDYPRARIVVVVDGRANPDIDAALAPFEGRIELLRNGERLGKSASLMRAAAGRSEDSSSSSTTTSSSARNRPSSGNSRSRWRAPTSPISPSRS